MKSKLLLAIALGFAFNCTVFAEGEATPWSGGAERLPYGPSIPAPLYDLTISGEDGGPIPAEVTEDVPMVVTANSDIFYETPPEKSSDGKEFSQARWVRNKASAIWIVVDWENNKSYNAIKPENFEQELAANQQAIVPVNPTEKGSLNCHVSRKMSYVDSESGEERTVYANSSTAVAFKVKDITPPTCGLQISVEDGYSGTCYPVENPPNHYPLPKTADVIFSGSLFGATDEDRFVQGYELGANMIVSNEDGSVTLPKNAVVTLKVVGDDNFKLNPDKVKFGVCAGAGGEPTPVSPINEEKIDFSTFVVPQNPYFYLDATDMAGNREVLFIPISIQ